MSDAHASNRLYGLIAEFEEADTVVDAAKRAYDAGYRKMDAYSPFPVHGLADALGPEDHRIKWIIFFMGLAGAGSGLLLEWWVSTVAYPHNVGGKELFSWPLFIPPAYECMILFASLGAFAGMLALNGLPRPHHPIFGAKRFELASQNRFFLCIEAEDPQFDRESTRAFMETLGAAEVSEVEHDDD